MPNNARALLEAERAALMAGDFEKLGKISVQLEELEKSINTPGKRQQDLAAIAQKAQQNAVLLRAAIKGIGVARVRLKAISDVRDNLSLYTQGGEKQNIQIGRTTLEKKA